jgi:flagellar biosynthetic protein FliQ
MEQAVFYDTMRQGLWLSVAISTPILAVALAAGLVVGLFQALTAIQEMTLTFVPKLGAIVAVFWLSMGFMTEALTAYFRGTIVPLIAGG